MINHFKPVTRKCDCGHTYIIEHPTQMHLLKCRACLYEDTKVKQMEIYNKKQAKKVRSRLGRKPHAYAHVYDNTDYAVVGGAR